MTKYITKLGYTNSIRCSHDLPESISNSGVIPKGLYD